MRAGSTRSDTERSHATARRWLRITFVVFVLIATLSVPTGPNSAARPQVSGSGTIITDIVPASTPNATGIHPIEPGSEMLVRGLTNRRPDQSVITVAVISGPSASAFEFVDVRRWGEDGVWTAVLSVPVDARPGSYVVRADDGSRGDRRTIEIVDRRVDPTVTTPARVPTTTLELTTPAPATDTTAARTTVDTATPDGAADAPADHDLFAAIVVGAFLALLFGIAIVRLWR